MLAGLAGKQYSTFMSEGLSRVQKKRGFLEPVPVKPQLSAKEQKEETIRTITKRLGGMKHKLQSPAVKSSRYAHLIEKHYTDACVHADRLLNELSLLVFFEHVRNFNEAAELFDQKLAAS